MTHADQSSTRSALWRRPPIYAATRLRCAIAMLVFALAVLVAALPSIARPGGCDGDLQAAGCHTTALVPAREVTLN